MISLELHYSLRLPSGGELRVARVVTPDELPGGVSAGSAARRQCERFTWHSLAREMMSNADAQFSYNSVGAPQIDGSELHISVSHSAHLVAVLISPLRCAVDIELQSRNFAAVCGRYISPSESDFSHSKLWSIKETLYKYGGQKEINLRDDIVVKTLQEDRFEARIPSVDGVVSGCVTTLRGHTLAYIG